MQAKHWHESELRTKAVALLRDFSTDSGDVVVEVSAELDRTLREATEMVKIDEKPTPLQSRNTTKTVDNVKNANAGRPGFEPNAGPNRSAQLNTQPESTNKVKESTDSETFAAGHATTLIDKVGFHIKSAKITVKIPQSYYQRMWEREWRDTQPPDKRDGTPEPMTATKLENYRKETKTRIEGQLVPLLPDLPAEAAGNDKIKLVSVDDYIDVPAPKFEGPSLASTGLVWLASSWQTLALIGVALFAVMMLRSAVKTQPKTNDEEFSRGFGVSMDSALAGGDLTSFGQDAGEDASGENAANPESAARRFAATGEQVREELSAVVRENPTVAVNILRSWIGDAA
jgi:flagellar M-ring protein FliF